MGYTPANTQKSTDYAIHVFKKWKLQKRGETRPEDLLDNPFIDNLNMWLARFVVEVRHVDGEPYPATTLYQMLAGL